MIVTRITEDGSPAAPAPAPVPPFTVVLHGGSGRFLALGHGGKLLASVPTTEVTAEHPARDLLTAMIAQGRRK